jgi:hypothetical protein
MNYLNCLFDLNLGAKIIYVYYISKLYNIHVVILNKSKSFNQL